MSWASESLRLLDRYDRTDLLAVVAALQLLPENADRLLRLQAASGLIASREFQGGSERVSPAELRRWMNDPPFADANLIAAEDPQESVQVEEIIFFGGSYKVLPGIVDEAVFIVRNLCKALFLRNPQPWSEAFQTEADALIRASLRLSDLVATKANVRRGQRPIHSNEVVVPGDLSHLSSAVRLDLDDLTSVLDGLDPSALDRLIVRPESVVASDGSPWLSSLLERPLIAVDDGLLLTIPTQLLASVRHATYCLAANYGVLDELAIRYQESVADSMMRSLKLFDLMKIDFPDTSKVSPFHETAYLLDTDKTLLCYVMTDSASDYDEGEVFGEWKDAEIAEAFDKRVLEVEQSVLGVHPAPNELLHLLVLQGIGRAGFVGVGGPLAPVHSLRHVTTAAQVEALSRLEHRDPLALWKYSRAGERIRDQVKMIVASDLDEFAWYRNNSYSYYASDGPRPDFVVIAPGTGSDLRYKAFDELDLHGVPHYDRGTTVEVVLVNGKSSEVPIYFPWQLLDEPPAQLVEADQLNLWAIGETSSDRKTLDLSNRLVDMVGYWLWQITIYFPLPQDEPTTIVFRIKPDLSDAWFESDVPLGPPSIELQGSGMTRDLLIPASLGRLLLGENNDGEQVVVEALLAALTEMLSPPHIYEPAALLEMVAPLGKKKKMLMLDVSKNLQLIPGKGLPRTRLVQDGDVAVVLDRVGERLSEQETVGSFAAERRVPILNKIVAEVFDDLERTVATLSPSSLLEWLIAHNEALLREDAQRALTIPTRLACFPEQSDIVGDLIREGPERVTSAVSSRFLIELIGARPPSGLRPISLDVFDELMALASEIYTKGTMSDAIRYDLADYALSLLPSGRLGVDREGDFETGRIRFLPVMADATVRHSHLDFSSHWDAESEDADPPEELEWLDSGARSEFGVSLTQIVHLLFEVIAVGQEQPGEAKSASPQALMDRIVDALDLPQALAEKVIDLFTLRERTSFEEVGDGFSKSDVYPWKFNRALSYVRRPLILRKSPDGGDELLWGTRHVDQAAQYLVKNLCYGGRLKANSSEMKDAMTRIRQRETSDFESEVAVPFLDKPPLLVRQRATSIAGQSIARSNGDVLGDIDALVVDPASRIILLNEAKDLALARTPIEMQRELETTFSNSSGSAACKHLERTRWISDHLELVLIDFGVSDGQLSRWVVQAIMVVDQVTMSPYISACPLPILAMHDLRVLMRDRNDVKEVLHRVRWTSSAHQAI